MSGPLLTQVAESVPFEESRNPDFNGLNSQITADNVQDAIEQAQPTIQQDGNFVNKVGDLNFTGPGVVVSNTGDYKATVNIQGVVPLAREATLIVMPGISWNDRSGLLFEADLVNDTIHFFTEMIL